MTARRRLRLDRDAERGSAGGTALEAVLLAPAVLLVMLLLIAGGRYVVGDSKVSSAAEAAARAASQQHTAAAADAAARKQAAAALSGAGLACQNPDVVSVDTAGFSAPPGTPVTVSVTLSCTVSLADLTLPGAPGHRTVTARAASPIDIHQERGP